MDWIRAHPYASAIAGACILLIGGIILIINRTSMPTSSGVSAWIGNPGSSNVPSVIPASSGNAQTPTETAENYGTQTLPYTAAAGATTTAGTAADGNFDYNALLAQLSQSASSKPSVAASGAIGNSSNAWSYIPGGLISTSSGAQPAMTPIQKALYIYGNEVGSYVQGYNATEGSNQVQAMKNALNDRQNAAKAQSVTAIGTAMENAGNGIASISDVPTEVLIDNTAFANSWNDSGKKLIALAQALPGRDADLVAAIETYDTSINTYITDYVALADLFKDYNVTFSSSDPGSVFTFSSSGL